MFKIRMKFTKKGYMVFISHLDLARMIERTLRRANIPLAFSQGFNPHPKISFATALSLGVSSDGEYIDIEIEEKIDIDEFERRVTEQLPEGVEIIQCMYIDKKSQSLTSIVEYSTYIVKCNVENDVTEDVIRKKIEEFLGNEEIMIYKTVKKRNKIKNKEINIRPMIKELGLIDKNDLTCIFKMTVATGEQGNLKPDVLMQKVNELTILSIVSESIRIQRLDLYAVKNNQLVTPIDISASL
ncbi:DUF2344 domain-containing protein [Lutibacter sp. B2]|nr:DUF2344 domain-containing protein [Lutibacter sp. B2]